MHTSYYVCFHNHNSYAIIYYLVVVVVVVVGLKPLYRLPLCVTQFVLAGISDMFVFLAIVSLSMIFSLLFHFQSPHQTPKYLKSFPQHFFPVTVAENQIDFLFPNRTDTPRGNDQVFLFQNHNKPGHCTAPFVNLFRQHNCNEFVLHLTINFAPSVLSIHFSSFTFIFLL